MPRNVVPEENAPRTGGESQAFVFARRVLVATLVVTGVVLALLFVWYAADLLMLVFAGVLISILLRGCSRVVSEKTGIGPRASLALVSPAMIGLIAVSVWLVTGRLGSQLTLLGQELPRAIENLGRYVGQFAWAREAIESLPSPGDWVAGRSGSIVARLTGLASTTVGVIVNAFVILIIGVYLASQPGLYAAGIKHLLPFGSRERAGEVLGEIDDALWRWLAGRFALMLVNGGATAVGLWLLGMPLAVTLGLLAGLLNFVPNFGPWIAAVPAVLIALLQSPQQALYVALLYLVLQALDAYVLTPLTDRRSVQLAPVLTITAQVLLGVAFGFLGILLASPLAAVALIVVRMLYVEDLLGDRTVREEGEAAEKTSDRRRTDVG
jgi:predicted PurR-regulated permease PerM